MKGSQQQSNTKAMQMEQQYVNGRKPLTVSTSGVKASEQKAIESPNFSLSGNCSCQSE